MTEQGYGLAGRTLSLELKLLGSRRQGQGQGLSVRVQGAEWRGRRLAMFFEFCISCMRSHSLHPAVCQKTPLRVCSVHTWP